MIYPVSDLQDLKLKIIRAIHTKSVTELENAQKNIIKRLRLCIQKNGEHC